MHHIMSSPKGPNISTSCNGITHICTLTLRIPNFHKQKFCQWLFWPFVECDHTLWPFPCLKMAPAWMLGSCVLVMGDLLSIYPLIHKMEMIAFSCRAHRTVVQFSSVAQSCPTLCDPMTHSTPGLPVHHQLLEFTQTHVHWVSDAIQTAHPLLSLSPPQSFPALGSFQMSQLFTSGGQGIGVSASTSVFPMNTQDWSPLGWTGWISLQSKGLSRDFSNTTVQKHQFFGTQLSL